MGTLELYLLISAVVIGLAVQAAVRDTRRRKRAVAERRVVDARYDEEMARRWDDLNRRAAMTPDADLVEVVDTYQPASRGTKAIIRWLATDVYQDTWFWGTRPAVGNIALVRGSTGWGPHNRNPDTFYVRPDQILILLPADAREAVARHRRRQGAA